MVDVTQFIGERGPWRAGPSSVASDDFTHDVYLTPKGDFGSDQALADYCQWLADRLNQRHIPDGYVRVPEGYVLVPVTPTEHILDALYSAESDMSDEALKTLWTEILAARPEVP